MPASHAAAQPSLPRTPCPNSPFFFFFPSLLSSWIKAVSPPRITNIIRLGDKKLSSSSLLIPLEAEEGSEEGLGVARTETNGPQNTSAAGRHVRVCFFFQQVSREAWLIINNYRTLNFPFCPDKAFVITLQVWSTASQGSRGRGGCSRRLGLSPLLPCFRTEHLCTPHLPPNRPPGNDCKPEVTQMQR